MPQAIAAAFTTFATFLASGTVLALFAQIGIGILLSVVTSKLFGPKALRTSFKGLQTQARGSLEPRKILYGEGKVGGVVTYNNTRDISNQWMDIEIAYLDHRAEAISFFFDDKEIPIADIDWTPSTTDTGAGSGTGEVSTAEFVKGATKAVTIQWMPGFNGQPANAKKVGDYTEQTTAHRLRGVFNAYISMLYTEVTASLWSAGPPKTIGLKLKGKPVFDRRRFALNSDPDFATVGKTVSSQKLRWFGDPVQSVIIDAGFSEAAGTLSITDNDNASENIHSERIPVDTAKLYTVSINARQTAGDRRNYLGVAFYDSVGDLINNSSSPVSDATGWPGGVGTYHYFIANSVLNATYQIETVTFGPGGTATIPTGAVTMAAIGLITRDGVVGTNSTVDLQDFTIYEATSRHSKTDDLTWEFSSNTAICLADYLSQYMDLNFDDDIDWDANIVAAQACDGIVSVPAPVNTQKRFTCNGALFTDENHEIVLEQLKGAMAGSIAWSGGKWIMKAGVYTAPTQTIDDTWLNGPVTVVGSVNKKERFNGITGFYSDPARKYETVEFQQVSIPAFVTRDAGRELDFDMSLPFTNTEFEAQRLALLKVDQFDNQISPTFEFNSKGLRIVPGSWWNITLPEFNWTNKVFRAVSWKPTNVGNFEVTFKEDFSSRYDDPLVGDYSTKTAAGTIVPPTRSPPAPSNFAIVGKSGLLELTWTNPAPRLFEYVEIWRSATDDINTATKLSEQRGSIFHDNVFDTTSRFYWVRTIDSAEQASIYEPSTTAGVPGTASNAGPTILYYIKPTNGTAIQNGVGTLTLEAHKVDGGVDTLLSTGTIQLFEGSTLVTVANGYAAGSDGYTGNLDSGDISGNAIITLKDGAGGTPLDTITLVDILDGSDAVFGFVEPENGLAWTRAPNAGSWTPAQLTTDLDCTFVQNGIPVARIARQITLTSSNGQLNVSTVVHKGGDLNIGRVTVTLDPPAGGGTTMTVQFKYSFGGDETAVAETVLSSQGGSDGATGPGGINTATITAYKRAAVAPTDDPGVSIIYTFVTAAWTPGNGWLKTIPAGTDPVYALSATAAGAGPTDNVLSADWSAPTLILQDGSAGGDGLNVATAFIYQRTLNDVAPALPSVSSTYTFATGIITGLNNGWTGNVPAAGGNDFLWISIATASNTTPTDAIAAAEWQAAEKLSETGADGTAGADGVLHYLTNEAHVLPSNFDGTGYDTLFTGAGGTHKVFDGIVDKTTIAVHSIVGGALKNGLTISVVSGTGVYSLSGALWTTDIETFTVRAVYNAVNYDKTYTIAKAKQGTDGGCALGTLTNASISRNQVGGTATVGFQCHTDGTIDTKSGSGAPPYVNKETWIGACTNAEYECRVDLTGGFTSGSAEETWLPTSTIQQWTMSGTGVDSTSGTFRIRRTSDNKVLKTVTLSLSIDATP